MTVKAQFENHEQWNDVKAVCTKLKENGFQALLAGGCVRDGLMGIHPNDFDIASDATPDQAAELFPTALEVGRQFGVTILPFKKFQLEVATFREDLEYRDGRRPEGVKFSTPEADAQRRDFTVNALFYDIEKDEVLDYVNGQVDLKARVLRTVGEPERRFEEDKLRLLRAVRFAAQLGFTIEPATYSEVKRLAPEVSVVSRERIRDELRKILKTSRPDLGLKLFEESGLRAVLFPELQSIANLNVTTRLESRLWKESDVLGLAAIFFSIRHWPTKELRSHLSSSVKLDNSTVELIINAFRLVEVFSETKALRKGELLMELSHPAAPLALQLLRFAIPAAQGRVTELESKAIDAFGDPLTKPVAFVTGQDLLSMGIKPSRKLGEMVAEVYLLQLEGQLRSREDALTWLKANLDS